MGATNLLRVDAQPLLERNRAPDSRHEDAPADFTDDRRWEARALRRVLHRAGDARGGGEPEVGSPDDDDAPATEPEQAPPRAGLPREAAVVALRLPTASPEALSGDVSDALQLLELPAADLVVVEAALPPAPAAPQAAAEVPAAALEAALAAAQRACESDGVAFALSLPVGARVAAGEWRQLLQRRAEWPLWAAHEVQASLADLGELGAHVEAAAERDVACLVRRPLDMHLPGSGRPFRCVGAPDHSDSSPHDDATRLTELLNTAVHLETMLDGDVGDAVRDANGGAAAPQAAMARTVASQLHSFGSLVQVGARGSAARLCPVCGRAPLTRACAVAIPVEHAAVARHQRRCAQREPRA